MSDGGAEMRIFSNAADLRPRKRKGLKIALASIAVLGLIAAGVAFGYYQILKTTPEYSLAMIVSSAETGNQNELNELVDTGAVVDSFLPQVLDKAAALYGRGIDPSLIQKMTVLATPLMPAVKARIKEKLPALINQKADRFKGVPVFAMALGARRYFDINVEGAKAEVVSRLPSESVEFTMEKRGKRWVVVSLRDEKLAESIAVSAGQEIMAAATGGTASGSTILDAKKINGLINEAEKIIQ